LKDEKQIEGLQTFFIGDTSFLKTIICIEISLSRTRVICVVYMSKINAE